MRCATCNTSLAARLAGAARCPVCGGAIVLEDCQGCGTKYAFGLDKCPHCGAAAGSPPADTRTPVVATEDAARHAAAAGGESTERVEPFDPAGYTAAEVNAHLEDADEDERVRVVVAEARGKNRATVLNRWGEYRPDVIDGGDTAEQLRGASAAGAGEVDDGADR